MYSLCSKTVKYLYPFQLIGMQVELDSQAAWCTHRPHFPWPKIKASAFRPGQFLSSPKHLNNVSQ